MPISDTLQGYNPFTREAFSLKHAQENPRETGAIGATAVTSCALLLIGALAASGVLALPTGVTAALIGAGGLGLAVTVGVKAYLSCNSTSGSSRGSTGSTNTGDCEFVDGAFGVLAHESSDGSSGSRGGDVGSGRGILSFFGLS